MKHSLINWQDGMKINQTHFQQSEFALVEKMAQGDRIGLSSHNYGLVEGDQIDVEWNVLTEPGGQVRIKVLRIHAITTSGNRIDISPEMSEETSHSLEGLVEKYGMNAELMVVLQVFPHEPKPFGAPDPDEYPPRIPFQRPSHKIGLLLRSDQEKISLGKFQAIIGQLNIRAGLVEKNDQYIPPLTKGGTSVVFRQKLQQWEQACLEIFDGCRKLARRADAVNKSSSQIISTDSGRTIAVADTARIFARAVALELSRVIPFLKTQAIHSSPEVAHVYFQQMAYGLFAEMEMLESESVNFFRKYMQEAFQQTWEPATATMMDSTYRHEQIADAVTEMDLFIGYLQIALRQIDGLPAKQLNFKTDFGMNVNFVEQPKPSRPDSTSTISFDEL